jgi:hypothetical protein
MSLLLLVVYFQIGVDEGTDTVNNPNDSPDDEEIEDVRTRG